MLNFKATVGTGVSHAFDTYIFEAGSMARAVSIADTAGRRNFGSDVRVISICEISEQTDRAHGAKSGKKSSASQSRKRRGGSR